MRNKIFSSEIFDVYHTPQEKFVEIFWMPLKLDLVIDSNAIIEAEKIFLKGLEVKYVLSDLSLASAVFRVNEQSEFSKLSTQNFLNIGVEKFAIILPDQFVPSLMTVQVVDEVEEIFESVEKMYQIDFFTSRALAKEWLFSEK